MEGFSVPAWVAPGGCWVQCWDRTAEGPRGPGCVGQCEIRGFLHKISRGLQTCWFGACSPDPIYPPPQEVYGPQAAEAGAAISRGHSLFLIPMFSVVINPVVFRKLFFWTG